MGPTGFEPATYRLRADRSDQAELRAHKSEVKFVIKNVSKSLLKILK